jgi:hypothetical protein
MTLYFKFYSKWQIMRVFPAECHFDCVGDGEIFCDTCETWFHYSCDNLTNKAFNLFSKSPLPYSCSLCIFYLDTREYKYEKALRRLSEATRKSITKYLPITYTIKVTFRREHSHYLSFWIEFEVERK